MRARKWRWNEKLGHNRKCWPKYLCCNTPNNDSTSPPLLSHTSRSSHGRNISTLNFLTQSILISCWQKHECCKGQDKGEGGIIYGVGYTAKILCSSAPSYAITKLLVIEINFFFSEVSLFWKKISPFLPCVSTRCLKFSFSRRLWKTDATYLTKVWCFN